MPEPAPKFDAVDSGSFRVIRQDDPDAPMSEVQRIELQVGEVVDVCIPNTTEVVRLRVEEHEGQPVLLVGLPES